MHDRTDVTREKEEVIVGQSSSGLDVHQLLDRKTILAQILAEHVQSSGRIEDLGRLGHDCFWMALVWCLGEEIWAVDGREESFPPKRKEKREERKRGRTEQKEKISFKWNRDASHG